MTVHYGSRFSCPASLFSIDLFNGFQGVRLRRSRMREVSVSFGLDCLVTMFTKNPG